MITKFKFCQFHDILSYVRCPVMCEINIQKTPVEEVPKVNKVEETDNVRSNLNVRWNSECAEEFCNSVNLDRVNELVQTVEEALDAIDASGSHAVDLDIEQSCI